MAVQPPKRIVVTENYGSKHRYKPIRSYGIMLFHKNKENGQPKVLLYQRRDNFEYMDFLRGVWTIEDNLYLLFSRMSSDERNRLVKYSFDVLWDDLWIDRTCRVYKDGYNRAKKKYNRIKAKIPYFLHNTKAYDAELQWGFPKGKKNRQAEDSLRCALREFTEETRISISEDDVVSEKSFEEYYHGSNNKFYSTEYFIAITSDISLPNFIETPHCIRDRAISEEAADVRWFTVSEAVQVLSPKRTKILLEAVDELKKCI